LVVVSGRPICIRRTISIILHRFLVNVLHVSREHSRRSFERSNRLQELGLQTRLEHLVAMRNEQLDNLRVEFYIVEVRHRLLFGSKHGRTETRRQIRCSHLILVTVRRDFIQVTH
jgi:hypothetical protein